MALDFRGRTERLFRRLEGGGEDSWLIVEAAGALDVTEFDFFRLAWRRWAGTEPDPRRIERVFAAYMFARKVPPWARHLAREVLRRQAAGRLAPDAFDASAVRRRDEPVPRAHAYAAAAAVTTAFAVALLILGTYRADPPDAHPRLECATGGMQFAEEVARQFTGRADPFDCGR